MTDTDFKAFRVLSTFLTVACRVCMMLKVKRTKDLYAIRKIVYQSVPNNLDFKPPQISASIKKALKLLMNNSTFSTAFLQIKICKGIHAFNYDPENTFMSRFIESEHNTTLLTSRFKLLSAICLLNLIVPS